MFKMRIFQVWPIAFDGYVYFSLSAFDSAKRAGPCSHLSTLRIQRIESPRSGLVWSFSPRVISRVLLSCTSSKPEGRSRLLMKSQGEHFRSEYSGGSAASSPVPVNQESWVCRGGTCSLTGAPWFVLAASLPPEPVGRSPTSTPAGRWSPGQSAPSPARCSPWSTASRRRPSQCLSSWSSGEWEPPGPPRGFPSWHVGSSPPPVCHGAWASFCRLNKGHNDSESFRGSWSGSGEIPPVRHVTQCLA